MQTPKISRDAFPQCILKKTKKLKSDTEMMLLLFFLLLSSYVLLTVIPI